MNRTGGTSRQSVAGERAPGIFKEGKGEEDLNRSGPVGRLVRCSVSLLASWREASPLSLTKCSRLYREGAEYEGEEDLELLHRSMFYSRINSRLLFVYDAVKVSVWFIQI